LPETTVIGLVFLPLIVWVYTFISSHAIVFDSWTLWI